MAKLKTNKDFRKLTPRDIVLGIGRKATDEEWDEYFKTHNKGKTKDASVVLKELKDHLQARQEKKKAS